MSYLPSSSSPQIHKKHLSISTPKQQDYYFPSHFPPSHRPRSSSSSSSSTLTSLTRLTAKRAALLVLAGFFSLAWVVANVSRDGRKWTGVWESAVGVKTQQEGRKTGLRVDENGIVWLAEEQGRGNRSEGIPEPLPVPDNLAALDGNSNSPADSTFSSPSAATGLLPVSLHPSLYTPPPLTQPLTLLSFSRLPPRVGWSCLSSFVAHGELCPALAGRFTPGGGEATKIDVVWTYVNGSEPKMKLWRKQAARMVENRKEGENAAGVLRHFREHDELKYSVRSVLSSFSSFPLAFFHFILGDIPSRPPSPSHPVDASGSTDDSSRLLQVPTWLETENLDVGGVSLRLQSHSELLQTRGSTEGEKSQDKRALSWRDKTVPSFNSLAIESQLSNVATDSPTVLAMNDDFFLLKPLSTSDVASPLFGPVFRMFREFVVEGVRTEDGKDDPEGEWRGLKNSNYMLNLRFGVRSRPYLAHVARSISQPLFREAHDVFFDAFDDTASTRFRGKGPNEITPYFVGQHYVVEKQREAILYSYLVLRSDANGDGVLTRSERRFLLSHLKTNNSFDVGSSTLYASTPQRTTLSSLSDLSTLAGILQPKETTFDFSSQDGFPYFAASDAHEETIPRWSGWPSFSPSSDNGEGLPCAIRLEQCLGSAFLDVSDESTTEVSTEETFKRVAFERTECGDCLIVLLLEKSGGKGLEAFLPPPEEKEDDVDDDGEDVEGSDAAMDPFAIGLDGTNWKDVSFSPVEGSGLSRRQQALSLIQRYAYTIGTSPLAFHSVSQGGPSLTATLRGLRNPANPSAGPAFLALNDDISSTDPEVLADCDERMKEWFEAEWKEPSPWENGGKEHRIDT